MASAQKSCVTYHGKLGPRRFRGNPHGQDIPTKIRQQQQNSTLSKLKGTLGKELPQNMNYLMGNNVTITDINDAANHLANRNYPEAFAPDGTKCGKTQICIPDIYLVATNAVEFVQPNKRSIEVDIQKFGQELSTDTQGNPVNIGKRPALKK